MKYKVNNEIILQSIGKSLIGFDAKKSYLYTFNATAELIFKKIKNGWEEERIIAALAKKYDVALPTLKKDVKTLIKNMVKNKIIYSTLSK